MPYNRLKYTFDYCKTNIPSFILVLLIIFFIDQLNEYNYLFEGISRVILILLSTILTLIFHGYGLVVTRNIMNYGDSLPKLTFYKSFVFGIKSSILVTLYGAVQYVIFLSVSVIFKLPFIEIKDGMIGISNLGSLFYEHNSLETILFFMFIIISLYIFTFFLEISLARLADKGSLRESLNIASVGKCISTIGWEHYAIDYTKLILSIVILAYIKFGLNFMIEHPLIDLIIGLLMFIIQYIGIGMIYKEYKEKKVKDTLIQHY